MAKGNPNPSPSTRFTSCGNPKGKPKGESVTSELRAVLKMRDPGTGQLNRRAIALKLVSMALSGNMEAIKEINNRAEGRLGVVVSAGADGEGSALQSVTINFVPFDAGSNG